jgi:hypothetical protein
LEVVCLVGSNKTLVLVVVVFSEPLLLEEGSSVDQLRAWEVLEAFSEVQFNPKPKATPNLVFKLVEVSSGSLLRVSVEEPQEAVYLGEAWVSRLLSNNNRLLSSVNNNSNNNLNLGSLVLQHREVDFSVSQPSHHLELGVTQVDFLELNLCNHKMPQLLVDNNKQEVVASLEPLKLEEQGSSIPKFPTQEGDGTVHLLLLSEEAGLLPRFKGHQDSNK